MNRSGWRTTTELVLLAFLAGWLAKWCHGQAGHQTPTDLVVMGLGAGVPLALSLARPRGPQ